MHRQCGRIQRQRRRQCWYLLLLALQQLAKAPGFGRVLPVPDHQRAVLLKKHRLRQRGQQLGPAAQAILAHAHHRQLGDYGLGQGRQHGGGHPGGGTCGLWPLRFVNLDPVALLRQPMRQQAAHQPSAQNHCVHGKPVDRFRASATVRQPDACA